jgi:hypothetical protein
MWGTTLKMWKEKVTAEGRCGARLFTFHFIEKETEDNVAIN